MIRVLITVDRLDTIFYVQILLDGVMIIKIVCVFFFSCALLVA